METSVTKKVSLVLPPMFIDVKERILLKAKALFMQYGIRSVSMDDIANSLGMSKKTLYQYYADKDELVEAVVEQHISSIQGDCIGSREKAKDAIHEIFMTMAMIKDEFNNMNPMMLFDMEKFHPRSFEKFTKYKDQFLAQIIRDNIEWGIKDELYRPDINIDIMVKFRLLSIMIPFNITVFSPGKYNLAEVSDHIISHFVYGLSTIKGHKLIQKYSQQDQKQIEI